jgi:hypothetical protein
LIPDRVSLQDCTWGTPFPRGGRGHCRLQEVGAVGKDTNATRLMRKGQLSIGECKSTPTARNGSFTLSLWVL